MVVQCVSAVRLQPLGVKGSNDNLGRFARGAPRVRGVFLLRLAYGGQAPYRSCKGMNARRRAPTLQRFKGLAGNGAEKKGGGRRIDGLRKIERQAAGNVGLKRGPGGSVGGALEDGGLTGETPATVAVNQPPAACRLVKASAPL